MSRVGNKPIEIPDGVKVDAAQGEVKVEGPLGKLSRRIPPLVGIKIEDGIVYVSRENETNRAKAMHGLARSLVNGMVIGVKDGFKKELEIVGVGYRAQASGQKLNLNIGYSHPVEYEVPQGIKVLVNDNTKISVEGFDKQLVGEVAATIRRFRKPEPYKGKGIRYVGERIIMKEGKTVG